MQEVRDAVLDREHRAVRMSLAPSQPCGKRREHRTGVDPWNLYRLRRARNLTRKALAQAMTTALVVHGLGACSALLIAAWEHGDARPSIDEVQRLAHVFDCGIDELLSCGECARDR